MNGIIGMDGKLFMTALNNEREAERSRMSAEEEQDLASRVSVKKPEIEMPQLNPFVDFVAADEENVERFVGNPVDAEKQNVERARLMMEVSKMLDAPDEYADGEHSAALEELNRRFTLTKQSLINFTKQYGGEGVKPSDLLRMYVEKMNNAADILSAPTGPRTDDAAKEFNDERWNEAMKFLGETFGDPDYLETRRAMAGMSREEQAKYAKEWMIKNGKITEDELRDEVNENKLVFPLTDSEKRAWVRSLTDDERADVTGMWNPEMTEYLDAISEGKPYVQTAEREALIRTPEAFKYIQMQNRREKWVREQRLIDRMEKAQTNERNFAEAMEIVPFMNEAQKKLVSAAAQGVDMNAYRGVFKLMDEKTRNTMEAVCNAVRPETEAGLGSGVELGYKRFKNSMTEFSTAAFYQAFKDVTAQDELAAEQKFNRDFNNTLGWDKLKDPSGWWEKAWVGLGESMPLQGSAIGGALAFRAATALAKHPVAKFGLTALGVGLEGIGLLSMAGDEYENLTLNGVKRKDAIPLAFASGIGQWMIENMNTEMILGTGLSANELMRIGLISSAKAGARCFSKKSVEQFGREFLFREFMETLRTDAAAAFKIALSENFEEFVQGIVSKGTEKYATGEKPLITAFIDPETIEAGAQSFKEAMPTCTLFGISGALFPAGSAFGLNQHGARAGAMMRMDEQLSTLLDEKVKNLGLDTKGEEFVKNWKASERKRIENRAAQIVRGTDGMLPGESTRWLNEQGDMTPAERAFYADMISFFNAARIQVGEVAAKAYADSNLQLFRYEAGGAKIAIDPNTGKVTGVTFKDADGDVAIGINDLTGDTATRKNLDAKVVADFISAWNAKHPNEAFKADLAKMDDTELARLDTALAENINGFYSESTGKITLTSQARAATLAHESGHATIWDALQKALDKQTGLSRSALRRIKARAEKEMGISRRDDEATAERVEATAEIEGATYKNALDYFEGADVGAAVKNVGKWIANIFRSKKAKSAYLPVIRKASVEAINPLQLVNEIVNEALPVALAEEKSRQKKNSEDKARGVARRGGNAADAVALRQQKIDAKIAARRAEAERKADELKAKEDALKAQAEAELKRKHEELLKAALEIKDRNRAEAEFRKMWEERLAIVRDQRRAAEAVANYEQWKNDEAHKEEVRKAQDALMQEVLAEIAKEEQDALDAIDRKYEEEFKLLADEEERNEAIRRAEEERQAKMAEQMLNNRKKATKEPPRLGHAKNQDGETAQRARAAYLAAWKAKSGKALSQGEIDQLADVYGLPPEALNLKKTGNGYRLTDKQMLTDESLAKFADGLVRLYTDISSVKIIVPDVVVATAEDAANAVPNEVYDPVTDTFVTGRVVVDAANAKTLREQAGMQEPEVSPAEIEEAMERRGIERKVPSGKQKAADTDYPSAADEIREYKFSLGKKAREDAKALLIKKRPDLLGDDVDALIRKREQYPDAGVLTEDPKIRKELEDEIYGKFVDEIGKFATPKEQKAALHWFIKGAIRLPEDAPKVTEAIQYGERAKGRANTDPMSYDSPMAMIEALHEFKPKAKPINPDKVPQLTDKREMGNGVVTYLVQDDREGQQAMREIINTHWGEDANPWCLLHGDGHGHLSDGSDGGYNAWHYWNHYNALPKRVAFKDGKLLAFMATDSVDTESEMPQDAYLTWLDNQGYSEDDAGNGEVPTYDEWFESYYIPENPPEQWWDRQDASHEGIPLGNIPVPNDPFGRWADFEIRDGEMKQIGGYVKWSNGNRTEWYANGFIASKQFVEGGVRKRINWNERGLVDSYSGERYGMKVNYMHNEDGEMYVRKVRVGPQNFYFDENGDLLDGGRYDTSYAGSDELELGKDTYLLREGKYSGECDRIHIYREDNVRGGDYVINCIVQLDRKTGDFVEYADDRIETTMDFDSLPEDAKEIVGVAQKKRIEIYRDAAAAKAEAEKFYRENSQTGRGTRFSIGVGDSLADRNKYDSVVRALSIRNKAPVDTLPYNATAQDAAKYFADNLLGKVLNMPNGETFKINEGHFFRLTCEGERKGFVDGFSTGIEAYNAIVGGNVSSDHIRGYKQDRAVMIPLFADIVEHPEIVLQNGNISQFIKRYETQDGRAMTAVFRMFNDGRKILSFHGFGSRYGELKHYRITYVSDAVKTGTSPATSVVQGIPLADGGIIPNNGGSGQVGTTHFSLVLGEQGAANLDDNVKVLENLQVAKRMLGDIKWADGWTQDERDRISAWKEKSHDEQLKIKLATGWEVGVDGKWRYEAADINRGLISDGDQDVKTEHNDLLKKRNEIVREMNDLVKQMNVIWDRIKKEHPEDAASFWGITPIADKDPEYSKLNSAHKELDSEYKKIARRIGALKRSNTKNKLGEIKTSGYLGPFIEGQPVGKAYPQLFDVKLQFKSYKGTEYGHYDPSNRTIVINARKSSEIMENTLVHEIQHAIQHIEGWTGGADPDSVGWDAYKRNAGEVEARNAERRTTDDIKKLLEDTEDVSRDVQIIRGEVGDALAKIEDASGDIRFSLNGTEHRAIWMHDTNERDYTGRILDGKKKGETRNRLGDIIPGKWMGLASDIHGFREIRGKAMFDDPIWITKDSPEYRDALIDGDPMFDIDDAVGGKWYYPVIDKQEFTTPITEMWKNSPRGTYTKFSISDAMPEGYAGTDAQGRTRFSIATYTNGGRDTLVKWMFGDVGKDLLAMSDKDLMAYIALSDEYKYLKGAAKTAFRKKLHPGFIPIDVKSAVGKGDLTIADGISIIRETDKVCETAQELAKTKEFKHFSNWSEVVVETDDEGHPIFGVVRPNGDYAYNLDFSTICKKRRPLDHIFASLVEDGTITDANINILLSEENIPKIQDIIKAHGLEVACALCFVDSKRYKIGEVAKDFSKMWNGILDMRENDPKKFEEAVRLAVRRKEDDAFLEWDDEDKVMKHKKPTFYDRAVMLIANDANARTKVDASWLISGEGMDEFARKFTAIHNLYRSFGGVSKAKDAHADVAWNNDIIRPFAHYTNPKSSMSSLTREKAYAVGGVRLQSFTDFIPALFFDYAQMTAELAAKHLPLHTYTKEVDFVKLFGLTGMKMNMSLVPGGTGVLWLTEAEGVKQGLVAIHGKDNKPVTKGGKVAFYDLVDECFPIKDAFELRRGSRNVGTIMVGVSDEHILLMLDDPRIDMVIPYHKSSLNGVVAAMRKIDKYDDYTDYQSTKKPDGAKDFDFYADLAKTKDPRKTASNYLAFCESNKGYTAKFTNSRQGTDFSKHPNYYKLLADFRLFEDDGKTYAPQGDVTQTYPKNLAALLKEAMEHDQRDMDALDRETEPIKDEVRAAVFKMGNEFAKAKKIAKPSKPSAKSNHFSLDNDNAERVAALVGAVGILKGDALSDQALDAIRKSTRASISIPDLRREAERLANENRRVLNYIAHDKVVDKLIARAGMADKLQKAIDRSRQADITFATGVQKKMERLNRANERVIRDTKGFTADTILNELGIDPAALLLSLRPDEVAKPVRTAPTEEEQTADAPHALDATMMGIAKQRAQELLGRARDAVARAKAEEAANPVEIDEDGKKESTRKGADENDPDVIIGTMMQNAILAEIRNSGMSIDNPAEMVKLAEVITEDYIKRHPDLYQGIDLADIWEDPRARALLGGNISRFAEMAAEAYCPTWTRERVAKKAQMLDDKAVRSMDAIEEIGVHMFEDLNRDIIRESRKSLIKQIHKKIDNLARHHEENALNKDRKVSSDLSAYLKKVKKAIDMSADDVEARIAELENLCNSRYQGVDEEKANHYRDYSEAQDEIYILSYWGNLKSKMPTEIKADFEYLDQLVNEDLYRMMQAREEYYAHIEESVGAMVGGIAPDPKNKGKKPTNDPWAYSVVGMFEAKYRQYIRFCKDPSAAQAAREAFATIEQMINDSSAAEVNFVTEFRERMKELLDECYGSADKARKMLTEVYDAPWYWVKIEGDKNPQVEDDVGLTAKRALQMYVSIVQDDYTENVEKWGRNGDYRAKLERLLGLVDEDGNYIADAPHAKFVEGLRALYLEMGERLDGVLFETTGTHLRTPNRNYMPVKMDRRIKLGKTGEGRAFSPFAPSLTPRIKNGRDFDQTADITDIWEGRLSDTAHTIGWAKTGPLIMQIAQSDALINTIGNNFGNAEARRWNNYIFDIVAGPRTTNPREAKSMKSLMHYSSILWLGYNIASWAKQLTSIPCLALSNQVTFRDMAAGMSMWALKPIQMCRTAYDLASSDAFKSRYGTAISNELRYAITDEGSFSTWKSRIVKHIMSGVVGFDKLGVLMSAGIYFRRRQQLELQGHPGAEASELAANWMMAIVDKTMQSGRTINLNEAQRNGGLSAFLQFMSAPIQQAQFEMVAYEEWSADKGNAEKFKNLVKVIVINHIAVPFGVAMIDTAMAFLTSWGIPDEEKRKRLYARILSEIIAGPLGSMFLIGAFIDYAGDVISQFATGSTSKYGSGIGQLVPAEGVLEFMGKNAENIVKALMEIDQAEYLDTAAQIGLAVGNLTPGASWLTRTGKKIHDSVTEDPYEKAKKERNRARRKAKAERDKYRKRK